MGKNEIRIEQQIKDRIKVFNRQRIISIIAIGFLLIVLSHLPLIAGYEIPPFYFAMLCSFGLISLSVTFVLSFRQATIIFLVSIMIMVGLLFTNQIRSTFFFMSVLVDAGAFAVSHKIARDFIKSATDEVSMIERLKIEATTDYLTQLLNRNGLEQAVETSWAFCKRNKMHVGFIMADIDFFKSYNDILGHLEGDKVLRKIAKCIKTCFKRQTDIISRYGGEEFLIFVSGIDDDQILEMAKVLSSTIYNLKIEAVDKNNSFEFLTVSMGIATSDPQAHDLSIDLYKQVDKALYHAKGKGRNCISFNGITINNTQVQSSNNITDNEYAAGILRSEFACKDSEG